jgi:hypothetical protein
VEFQDIVAEVSRQVEAHRSVADQKEADYQQKRKELWPIVAVDAAKHAVKMHYDSIAPRVFAEWLGISITSADLLRAAESIWDSRDSIPDDFMPPRADWKAEEYEYMRSHKMKVFKDALINCTLLS